MADERETILEFLCTTLRLVPGVALVTRFDHRQIIGSKSEWPAICVVDLGDDVVSRDSNRTNERHLRVALVTVLQGSTEDAVGSEMSAFNALVRKQIYGATQPVVFTASGYTRCQYIDDMYPTATSPLAYVRTGSRVACQGQEFRILYQEQITSLFK